MVIALLIGSILLEFLLYARLLWSFRLPLLYVYTLLISGVTTAFVWQHTTIVGVVIAVVSVFRLLNLFRIAENRLHAVYLLTATRKTSIWLGLFTIVLVALSDILGADISRSSVMTVIAYIQLIAAVAICFMAFRNIYKTRYRQKQQFYADKDLPTVSVLIPARNETYDLEECLRLLLQNDYPKLEIIVLDDCSHLRTSDIIKGFAHDGVRFVKGSEPSEKWLAKNLAYEKLRTEASGEILLFCGVDTRFGPHAIKALITELLVRDKDMISVMPRRLSGELKNAFLQPMRYWWELAFPRKFIGKPAVLSTCWVIKKAELEKLGGFSGVSHSIIPERFFAREEVKTDKYSFIRANDVMDIQTHKSLFEQRQTAIRVKYPQLSKRPELVLLLLSVEFLILLGPFIGLILAFLWEIHGIVAVSSIAALLLIIVHTSIMYVTNPPNSVVALWNFPLSVLGEISVTWLSMVRYEFGVVNWKERNVCIPVMQVVPHLPKLADGDTDQGQGNL